MSIDILETSAPAVDVQVMPDTGAAVGPSTEILDVVFFQLDINNSAPIHIPFRQQDHNDLHDYLRGLVKEISEKDSKREFEFETTGVFKLYMAELATTPKLTTKEIGENLGKV